MCMRTGFVFGKAERRAGTFKIGIDPLLNIMDNISHWAISSIYSGRKYYDLSNGIGFIKKFREKLKLCFCLHF